MYFATAVESIPARKHKKRRNQTEAYHKRIQKKWNKRFRVTPEAISLIGLSEFAMQQIRNTMSLKGKV